MRTFSYAEGAVRVRSLKPVGDSHSSGPDVREETGAGAILSRWRPAAQMDLAMTGIHQREHTYCYAAR